MLIIILSIIAISLFLAWYKISLVKTKYTQLILDIIYFFQTNCNLSNNIELYKTLTNIHNIIDVNNNSIFQTLHSYKYAILNDINNVEKYKRICIVGVLCNNTSDFKDFVRDELDFFKSENSMVDILDETETSITVTINNNNYRYTAVYDTWCCFGSTFNAYRKTPDFKRNNQYNQIKKEFINNLSSEYIDE